VINGFASFGLLATSDAFIVDITSPRLVGAAIGINLATSFAMSVIVPPILGNCIDKYGFDASFTLISVFSLLSLLPLDRLRGRYKKP
ncbi:MAG: hypothetical protein QXI32_04050, partial [Candidatus Bathyarchaeia archaeon]